MADELPHNVFIPIKIAVEIDGDSGGDPLEFNLPLSKVAAFLAWLAAAEEFAV